MKICPNCGKEHNNPRSDYCGEMVFKKCDSCGGEYETKCNKRIKKTCSKKCSHNTKRNKCLNCGEPCKEKYCGKDIEITCKYCGKKKIIKCDREMPVYCSSTCATRDPEMKEKIKQTQLKNNGGVYAFNTPKQKETMIERYGYETPAKNEKVKQKAKETQFENNNGVYAFNTNSQKETMMEKYGSLGRLGNPSELKKQQEIMMEKYGVKTPTEHPEFLAKSMNTLKECYGQIFNNGTISKVNKNFANLLIDQFDIGIEYEHYIKNGGIFLDIYIPKNDISIEINPTVTHNSTRSFTCLRNSCDIGCVDHKPTKSTYHYERAKIARDNNFRLIQIYDWDNQDSILNLIGNKVKPINKKYSARKLKTKNISQAEANKFLIDTHIQGGSKKQLYCYGLFDGIDLLAVATFSKARFKSKAQWEFMRYAVKDGVIIHGGSSKLVKTFIDEVNPNTIISYIDFNHTTLKNTFLNTIGFEEIEDTGPRLIFHRLKDNKAIPMTSLLMIGADRLLKTSYGSISECGMDNEQIMLNEGFQKVYTAGNRVFLWRKENAN